jgi:hypothetical protein
MILNNLCFLLFLSIKAMPAISDDDSASSDKKWWSRRRSEQLLKEKEDEDQKQQLALRNTWGGSKPGWNPKIERDREFFHQVLMRDYFVEWLMYHANFFRRHF